MKRALRASPVLPTFGPLSVSVSATAHANARGDASVSRTADVDGVKLHYLTGGQGPR